MAVNSLVEWLTSTHLPFCVHSKVSANDSTLAGVLNQPMPSLCVYSRIKQSVNLFLVNEEQKSEVASLCARPVHILHDLPYACS